jgi:hypothetical protein
MPQMKIFFFPFDMLKIIVTFVLELSGKGFVPPGRLSTLCFSQGVVYFRL